MRISKRKARAVAISEGYRSKFEHTFNQTIADLGFKANYESDRIKYIQPERVKTYIPDWTIRKNVYIETKGRFTATDRMKMLMVIKSNPQIKIYMLFQNSNVTLSKKSKTTYGEWCTKNNIDWADIKEIDKWKRWFK